MFNSSIEKVDMNSAIPYIASDFSEGLFCYLAMKRASSVHFQ